MTNKLRAAAQQALEALMDFARFQSMMMDGPDVSDKLLAEDYAEAGFMNMAAAIPALRAALAEQPAEQGPVDWTWVDLQNRAAEIVRGKSLWKRFIDGTPLSNDIACWMADFAQEVMAPQPAKQPLTDDEISDLAMRSGAYDEQLLEFARAIERAHGINVPQARGETK